MRLRAKAISFGLGCHDLGRLEKNIVVGNAKRERKRERSNVQYIQ